MDIRIGAVVASKVGFASHQNAVPLIRELEIVNDSSEPVNDLTLSLQADPPFLTRKIWRIDQLSAGSTLHITDRDVSLSAAVLGDLTESMVGNVTLRLEAESGVLAETCYPVELLARNQWGGTSSMAELLPAFVMPNDPAVDRILKAASDVLRRAGHKDGIDGYEAKSRKRVWELTSAIWSAICSLRLSYALPPASFESNGQKVRTPSAILEGKVSTCLDTALLFAAALEQAGLNPLIVLTRGHAFAGVWLQPLEFSSLITDEAAALRRRIDLQELLVFETTLATQAHPAKLSQAEQAAQRLIAEDAPDAFEVAVDIRRARMQKIRPLSLIGQTRPDDCDETAPSAIEALEAAPDLPDFDIEATEETDRVKDRISLWQRRLLNLTTSNRLLHLPDNARAVRLVCPKPALLEDLLSQGKKIRIVAMPDPGTGGRDEKLYEAQTRENLRQQLAMAALDRGEVLSATEKSRLDADLIDLYRKAKSDLDEGGANTLYLALGFLKWKKSPSEARTYRAPLILVPVKLERKSALSGVTMSLHEDEPRFNLTLLELLRQDFELEIPALEGPLPGDEHGVDVEQVWTAVRRAVRDMAGFEVVPDVALGTFSFAKYLMWKDLVDRADHLKESPVVRHLIERQGTVFERAGDFPKPEQLDKKIDPSMLFTPLPADSSQLAAVVASAEGHNFVLDGPPGTGKSQTIANMIAHNLALGRRVLFVAEKMAALNVVQRRLEEKGLGDFCLELHSSKATKSEVLKQLDRAWTAREMMSEAEWTREAAKAKQLRDNLNEVMELLHRRRRNGLTLHAAIGRVIRDWNDSLPRLQFGAGVQHDESIFARIRESARRLGLARREVQDLPNTLTIVSRSEWSNSWQEALIAAARQLPEAVDEMASARSALLQATRLPLVAEDQASLKRLLAFVDVLLDTHGHDMRVAFAPDMPDRAAAVHEAKQLIDSYRAEEARLSSSYAPEAARRIDLNAQEAAWQAAEQKFWFLSALAKRKVARSLAQAGGAAGEVDPSTDLPRLRMLAGLLEKLDTLGTRLAGLPGWSGLTSDISAMEAYCALAERLRATINTTASDPEHLVALRQAASTLAIEANDLLGPDGAIAAARARLAAACAALDKAVLEFMRYAGAADDRTSSYEALRSAALTVITHEPRLKAWADWQRARIDAMSNALAPLVEALEKGAVQPEESLNVFETSYARWFATQGIDAEPVLRQFASSLHMDNIEAFRQIDDRLAELSVRYIRAKICGHIPAKETIGKSGGFAVLRHQLQLQRRHKPIRQLAAEMGDAFTRLAPCMLMSPLSIAQYLPADQALFDLVIFDEASQIAPWDAIGAMARGKQVVVAGDPRQMPPTSFFTRAAGATDSDGDTEEDMESILDECLAAGVPMHSLSWHYRSRHESLIAFSNHRYYESNLVTFPAPVTRPSAVEWRRVDGVYARGTGRINEIEAKAIVEEAVRRLTCPKFNSAGWSLGIITLNADQQKLIENLLDEARRKHPEIEPHFSEDRTEPVVVKNLETVQGDERDVIILGIGFGPTEPGGQTMSMSFGALNNQGGWRRLNVAITRARQEMLVFTSFDPGMIDLNRTSARAVADLKHFLEFAQRGPRALAEAIHGSVGGFDSPFEEAVASELQRRGWTVVPQIGVSRFRIDLGIVHPDRPGDYLVGVECDGATYHSAATARDRDKVRAAILQGLGWKLLRIWSTDWWVDKAGAAEKLHNQILAVLEASRAETAQSSIVEQNDAPLERADTADEAPEPVNEEAAEPIRLHVENPPSGAVSPPVEPVQAVFARQFADAPSPILYRVSDLTAFGDKIDSDRFYDAAYDAVLIELIEYVLEQEAPIAETLLVQRIARAHGFQRSGRLIRDRIMSIAERQYHIATDAGGNKFVWPDSDAPRHWRSCRIPATENDVRSIEEIAPEEIRAAAQFEDGNDAAASIARKFGIRRLSSTVRSRIEEVLS